MFLLADDGREQIVGWPPIRSYRKTCLQMRKNDRVDGAGMYVKVSVDGAPYLRKIDLKVYKSYPELLKALEDMFKLTIGEYMPLRSLITYMIINDDGLNIVLSVLIRVKTIFSGEYSEKEGYNGSDFAPTYEDKDGDWMLVGDVPWE